MNNHSTCHRSQVQELHTLLLNNNCNNNNNNDKIMIQCSGPQP